ncbi:MAG: M20 family metallopeptidase [Hyphomicrobiales bacterium]
MTDLANIADLRHSALDLLADWTPLRSIAGNELGLRRMANLVAGHLRQTMGATIVDAGLRFDPPVVHARIDIGAPTTILLYNMYDVMPATSAGWSVDPFTGGIVEAPDGPRYVARGAENNKGPMAAMLVAARHLLAKGALGANLEILLEGQEDTGSAQLRRYLTAKDTPVRKAAAALFPSFCEYGGGAPRIYYGFKGIAHGTISFESGGWGGPKTACHSSNSPWIANPAWSLIQALAQLAAGERGRGVIPPGLRPVLARLAETFDPRAELAFRATERFSIDGSAHDLLTHVLSAAHLNVSDLWTSPPAGRGIIPVTACARFDLRWPPGLDCEGELARLAVDCAPAELTVEDAYPGRSFSPDALGFQELVNTYNALGAAPQCWPWAIGAAPAYAFANLSEAFIIGGLGTGGNAHGVDEFVELRGIDRFLQSLLLWLPALAVRAAAASRARS